MSQPLVGAPRNRVDGRLKVTGTAAYTADRAVREMTHAVVVPSTIAKGRIVSIDDSHSRSVEGVLEVMTHRNAPRVDPKKTQPEQSLLYLLQNDEIQFDRQPVAVVVAETFEQALHAAQLVRVEYEKEAPQTDMATAERFLPKAIFGEPATHQRGTPDSALAQAAVRIDQTYRTPTEHHNSMETHGTLAHWEGDRLTLYDSTQWAFGVQKRLATIFGIEPSNIRVVAEFVGGAFGSKGQAWSHVPLAAMAAKLVNRPVKLLLTRPQMFGWVGHRPQTEQHVVLGADRDGKLVAVTHAVRAETSVADEFLEPSAVFSRDLYAVQNYGMSHELRRLNISKPTYQRGPGESTGSFAMESAMDELAYALNIDPVELRLRNYSAANPDSGKPYSSKNLRECYARAAEQFGWARRNPRVRSMRSGNMLAGYGMATASRNVHRDEASARFIFKRDGTLTIQSGTIEQGTGSSTVFSQLAAEILDMPYERVRFEWGDTALPDAPLAAGSQTAASIGSAIVKGAAQLRAQLQQGGGSIPAEGIDFVVHEKPGEEEEKYATQTFGAHFAQVEVDSDLGMVRVVRYVGAFDGGRILNEKTARSQFIGGIVWGISMALHEQTRYDTRTARIMNANLSEYLVPSHADIPAIETIIIEEDDPHVNPAGVKGIGEVGITGAAAAVANAVYHATGIRVRDLPIVPEKLLA